MPKDLQRQLLLSYDHEQLDSTLRTYQVRVRLSERHTRTVDSDRLLNQLYGKLDLNPVHFKSLDAMLDRLARLETQQRAALARAVQIHEKVMALLQTYSKMISFFMALCATTGGQ